MNIGKTLCAPLMEFLPWTTFTRIVDRQGGDTLGLHLRETPTRVT